VTRPPLRLLGPLVPWQDGNNASHRRAKIAVGIPDAAVRPRCPGLVILVEMRMEPAVIYKRPVTAVKAMVLNGLGLGNTNSLVSHGSFNT
jgi:hypothetical protein